MVPDVAGEATSHETLSRGLASTRGGGPWGAMDSSSRQGQSPRGEGLAWPWVVASMTPLSPAQPSPNS